jgi:hypothetical protein
MDTPEERTRIAPLEEGKCNQRRPAIANQPLQPLE